MAKVRRDYAVQQSSYVCAGMAAHPLTSQSVLSLTPPVTSVACFMDAVSMSANQNLSFDDQSAQSQSKGERTLQRIALRTGVIVVTCTLAVHL